MGDNFLKKKAAGLLDCKVEKAEVTDGRGLFAGIRGFIHISKESLGKVTKSQALLKQGHTDGLPFFAATGREYSL